MADKQAELTVGGENYDFPALKGSCGPDVIDIRKLYGKTGKFTFDPGLQVDRQLRKRADLHRWRRRRSAAPRLSDRPAGRTFQLHGSQPICC